MQLATCLLLLSAMLLTGCFGRKTEVVSNQARKPGEKLIVTPETMLMGRVVRVNENARYAVLNFPVGTMPANDTRMSVYRRGLKVAEVKVTGPQENDNTVADILNGEVQAGDELRSN